MNILIAFKKNNSGNISSDKNNNDNDNANNSSLQLGYLEQSTNPNPPKKMFCTFPKKTVFQVYLKKQTT